jgi:hypothetical protein
LNPSPAPTQGGGQSIAPSPAPTQGTEQNTAEENKRQKDENGGFFHNWWDYYKSEIRNSTSNWDAIRNTFTAPFTTVDDAWNARHGLSPQQRSQSVGGPAPIDPNTGKPAAAWPPVIPGFTPGYRDPTESELLTLERAGFGVPKTMPVEPRTTLPMGKGTAVPGWTYPMDTAQADELYARYMTPEARAKGFVPPANMTSRPTEQAFVGANFVVAPVADTDYFKLNPVQQGKIDWNTAYSVARRRDDADMTAGRKYSDAEQKEMDAAITRITGSSSGGTTRQAKNMIDFLDKIGFRAPGMDIDQFLNEDHMFSALDVQNTKASTAADGFKTMQEIAGGTVDLSKLSEAEKAKTYSTFVNPENMRKLDMTGMRQTFETLKKNMKKADLVGRWDVIAMLDQKKVGEYYKTQAPNDPFIESIPYGYTPIGASYKQPDADQTPWDINLSQAWEQLKRGATNEAVQNNFKNNEFTEQDKKNFYDWIQKRIWNEIRYGAPENPQHTRTAAQIATMLGLSAEVSGNG